MDAWVYSEEAAMKLTCYRGSDTAAAIVPGRPERDWMDSAPERQPYRCLPLTIANTTGWEMQSPIGFSAHWDGRLTPDAVKVRFDEPSSSRFVETYFGNGVITFHHGWHFKTEPGWDLWIGGPPNTIKHGIAPLTGIIETYWLPQPFTMNWRFTAPGTVRFEKDESFALIMPVPHSAIDDVEPVIEHLQDNPEDMAATKSWLESRRDWIRRKEEGGPDAPTDQWQRHYFQGVNADGTPGPSDHIAKRRVKPLRPASDGKP
ncbi:MAG: DUF6065 family protein [Hyphomonadaceae bacterium]